MKKTLAVLICLALIVSLTGIVPAVAEEAPAGPEAYLMYADSAWAYQYWGGEAPEGVTAKNAAVTGAGTYTVGLEFAEEAQGLAFTAVGITDGELALPGYTIEISAIRVNGEEIAFEKGYTSSDDGIVTRMNIYNEWVTEVPTDARSFDGKTDDAKPVIVDKELFAAVKSVEVDFTLHQFGVDTAYIMYADANWAYQYWSGDAPEGVTAVNAVIDGFGDYTVGLEFAEDAQGLAFSAVGIVNGEKTFNGYFINVTDIKVNGVSFVLCLGYTSSDDGITTRENLYNEWVTELPVDARRADGDLTDASPIIVDKEAFAAVKSVEVTFELIYGKPIAKEEANALKEAGFHAYIGVQGKDTYVFRNAWNDSYGMNDAEHPYFYRLTGWDNPDTEDGSDDLGGSFVDVEITGDGEYTVSLTTGERGFGATEEFNLLFVSTDIPSKLIADGFLTIDGVKIKIGGAATQEYTNVNIEEGAYARIDVINVYGTGADFGYTVPGPNETITITFTVSGW